MSAAAHAPVMVREMLEVLSPRAGARLVDATFGRGGHSRAILKAADCLVFAIDRDAEAIAAGEALRRRFPGRLIMLRGRFGDMEHLLAEVGVETVDGVALDLGVSSPQIDDAARGFSFREDGPLDMRMGEDGPSAADFVNEASEAEISRVIRDLGEERRARAVAHAIVSARRQRPIERTGELAEIVAKVVRRAPCGVHPATRTFQALRIHVNDELGQLESGLAATERLLKPGGRLVVIAFHSLEDRAVKRFLARCSGTEPRPSRHLPEKSGARAEPSFRLLFPGARKPRADEVAANPRARSARMRAAVRTPAPARPVETGA